MVRDDRFYAFIAARTSRSRSDIRRICFHKRWLKVIGCLAAILFCAALYGFYGLTQQAAHLQVERENERLRLENERQRQQLNQLNNRVEAVEDATRRLAEISGVEHGQHNQQMNLRGSGGPSVPLDDVTATEIEDKTRHLEQNLRTYETLLRARAMTPSIWPVLGELNDRFGGRRNPFGDSSSEFHTGLDIGATPGTPVMAAASGTVIFAGWRSGYGQLVEVDHGNGLTTRYGHLSRIGVAAGQTLSRGETVGSVGSTGRSTGPHLHYEVRIYDQPVNPKRYLPINAE